MPAACYISEHDSPVKIRILSTALRLFVERGLCETTVRDIAAGAQCTNPALFKHFENKDALALFLFEQCYRWLYQMVSTAIAVHSGYEQRQRDLVVRYLDALESDSPAVLFAPENLRHFWPSVRPAIRRHSIVAAIHKMLEDGQREGVVTRALSVRMLAIGWLGTLQQFARIWYFDRHTGSGSASELHEILMKIVAI